MDETYRRLGSEREAEFERHALKWSRAAEVRQQRRSHPRKKVLHIVLARLGRDPAPTPEPRLLSR